jgi:O-antigen/teichoic acid export membrane protein
LINAIVVLLIVGGGIQLLITLNTGAAILMTIVAAGIFYRRAAGRFPEVKWRADARLIPPMLKYSLKGFVLWVSTFLVYRLDLMIVNYFRGTAEAGVYAVATQCTMLLLLIPHAISHLLQARVSATQDEGGDFSCRVARNTSLLLFAACLLSVPGAFLISSVYGSAFSDLVVQLWILLPGVYLLGVQLVLSQYFIGTGMPVFLPLTWLATLVLNIALNLVVVPLYGARGAALASTICYAGISLVVLTLFKTKTYHSLRSILIPSIGEIRSLPGLLMRPPVGGES